ncbi:hypothetical protein [Lacticaseibacillus paracasei]|uniref:Phage protein n=1 Tax=Lacticaseibacillus paracasei NRIC 0644 TaxID=1435038 RepID=A0A0C9NWX0_LACPA|nr:hypothetical protein [Lacticaseibacillus paracasei]GAN36470.1 hypothetical protein LC0644_1059 [Lacticaseibacillus paracasei NRIC 0644]GAN39237.1 hypothetical protein LC1917_1114 [Lacticaseibacillus paracasei NRIC 1917]
MSDDELLLILKTNLGISSTTRDTYLKPLLKSTRDELVNQKGIPVDDVTSEMFLVDLTAFRYRNRGEGVMPRNLAYRLHNLMIHRQGEQSRAASTDGGGD